MVMQGANDCSGEHPCVTVAGWREAGKRSLIQRLISSGLDRSRQRSALSPRNGGNRGASFACTWFVDTKYYNATVRLESFSLEEPMMNCEIPGGSMCEALILVADSSNRESWVQARKWAATRSADALDSVDVKLCVLNKLDIVASRRCPWIDEVEEWCLDNCFELVQVSCTDLALDESLSCGEHSDDPQGVLRVSEALKAHMWTGMQMKESRPFGSDNSASGKDPKPVTSSNPITQEQLPSFDARDIMQADIKAESRNQPKHRCSVAMDAHQSGDLDGMFSGMHFTGEAEGSYGNHTALAAGDNIRSSYIESMSPLEAVDADSAVDELRNCSSDADGPWEIDQMEALIAKASSHRAMLSQMPDDQRRAKAADIALQLMAMMGLDLEEEDGEDEK